MTHDACQRDLAVYSQLRSLSGDNYFVVGAHVSEDITRCFFNDIGVGNFGRKKRHVVAELRPYGLEAFDFEVEQCGTFLQLAPRIEPVTAISDVIAEIGRQAQAGERHRQLL